LAEEQTNVGDAEGGEVSSGCMAFIFADNALGKLHKNWDLKNIGD